MKKLGTLLSKQSVWVLSLLVLSGCQTVGRTVGPG